MDTTNPRPLALVTGASSGIGYELAKQFANHGFDLVIAAEDDGIDSAASELEALGARAQAVQVDLATHEGVERLHGSLGGRTPDAAALNAGVGTSGPFIDTGLEDDLRVVDLNVRSTVHLAKYMARAMAARGEGRILLTSSIAATLPGPFQSTYNASKSFVQSFALALRHELSDTGVTVTALMPGPTETEFFERAGMEDTKLGQADKDSAEDVARDGFEALMAGKERVVAHSLKTKAQEMGSRLIPDSVKAAMQGKMVEPGSARD
jgi:short-subunit dehydrogenase